MPIGTIIGKIGEDVNAGAAYAAHNYPDYTQNPWNSFRAANQMPDYPEQLRNALMNARYEGQPQTEEEDPLIQYLRDMLNRRGNPVWE